ncbi:MAG: hypothetical protein AAFQ83_25015 [Bacteroidota bacterium]
MENILTEQLTVDYKELGDKIYYAPRLFDNLLYPSPLGTPFPWQNMSPTQFVIACYRAGHRLVGGGPLDERDIEILRDYLIYFIHAPCWTKIAMDTEDEEYSQTLLTRRKESFELDTVDKISEYLAALREFGLDPF